MSNRRGREDLKIRLSELRNGQLINAFPVALRNIIHQQEWKLGDREYRDLNADLLFQHLQVVEAKTIWLDLNKKSAILNEITSPTFPNLLELFLGDNNIASFQGAYIAKTIFKYLFFHQDHNKITNIKPLRRVRFPELLELNLRGNFIQQESQIVECNFPKLEKLYLDYPNPKQKIFENPWFVKTQFRHQVSISSGKTKLSTFTLKMFLTLLQEASPKQPKNLFKTFQN